MRSIHPHRHPGTRWQRAVMVVMAAAMPMVGATAYAQTQDQIEVPLPFARGAAFDRVMEAFVREGLSVRQTDRDAGVLVSETVNIKSGLAAVRVTYHATVLSQSDSSSIVLLVGTYPTKTGPVLVGSETEDVRLQSNGRGPWGKAWQQLGKIAARLQSSQR